MSQLIIDKLTHFLEKHNEFDNDVIIQQISTMLDEFQERPVPPHEIIELFFSTHHYYYISTSNLYIEYKHSSYTIINENNFIHQILEYLNERRNEYLLDTPTKGVILLRIKKIIKSKSIYDSIPESETLQNILSFFYPNLFDEKQYCKYFLTVIGDVIMKKNNCVYFIPMFMKSFLQQLNKYICLYFHSINIFQWFKFKYTEHDKTISRVIQMKPLNMSFFNLSESFFINMICVSIHYSARHSSSEAYLSELIPEVKHNILWIQEESKESMITKFIDSYIIEKKDCMMDEKDMLFLWKSYLTKECKLNVFQKKQELFDIIQSYIEVRNNKFINVYSLFLPYVETFKDFWDKHIYVDNNEYDFELNELYDIYCSIYKSKINEYIFKDLIEFYYPSIVIIEDKYIKQIGCTLWNKKKELEPYIKEGDINDLYYNYCKEFKSIRKVSKKYFTQYHNNYLIK
jgi:hypothetical protein